MKHIVSMHQSQYLPWPPFFKKMALADTFVLMDTVQFQKNGLQNRNKISSANGAYWLTIPVNSKLSESILEKQAVDIRWKKKHLKSIRSSYSKARYFDCYFDKLERIINSASMNLSHINYELICFLRDVLGIKNDMVLLSELSVNGHKSELIIEACRALQATHYISGIGGKAYLDRTMFSDNEINLIFCSSETPYYDQIHPPTQGLSILDWLFQDKLENIKRYIHGSGD